MKIQPRTMTVRKAAMDLSEQVMRIAIGLTPAEVVAILAEQIQQYNKYALRQERHGNMDKKADEE